jgi:hypothetical protein
MSAGACKIDRSLWQGGVVAAPARVVAARPARVFPRNAGARGATDWAVEAAAGEQPALAGASTSRPGLLQAPVVTTQDRCSLWRAQAHVCIMCGVRASERGLALRAHAWAWGSATGACIALANAGGSGCHNAGRGCHNAGHPATPEMGENRKIQL